MIKQPFQFNTQRRDLMCAAGGLALVASPLGGAFAQKIPSTLEIVCGYSAGGTADLLSRLVADNISKDHIKTVIVQNKPGALAQVSVGYVKNRPATGADVLQVAIVLFTLFPHIYKSLSYDPKNDFVPLTSACSVEYGLALGPMVPESVKTVEQYIEWTRLDPRNATFAVAGMLPQTLGSLLAKLTDMPLEPVSYKGGSPAVIDTMAGQVPSVITTLGDLLPSMGDRLRILAIASEKRNPIMPDVPTFAEQGLSEMLATTYFPFFVRSETPEKIIASHSETFRKAVSRQPVVDGLARVAMTATPTDHVESREIMAKDYEQWGRVIERIGLQPI